MSKKLLGLFLSFSSLFMVLFGTAVFAADVDGVYLNGDKLIFSDAQPIIVNSRVMVPVRTTADYFGMVTEWNKQTETMTFKKGNRVIVHKMRSNVITVNGEALTFDTASINSMNRTLMPVRMLAEAMGADVQWDNAARRVIISTDSPAVLSAVPSATAASTGQSVLITITASANTEKVKLIDTDSNTMVNESFVYNENGDGTRVFTLNWIPTTSNTGYKSARVYAGNSGGYLSDTTGSQTVTISVAADSSPKVKNYNVSKYSVDKNDYVTVTVYTNSTATRVKVENDFNAATKELTSYTTSGDDKVFEGRIKMSTSGNRELTIYAGNSKGYSSDYINVTIDVDKNSSSRDDDDDDEDMKIRKIDVSDDEIGRGGEVTVKIETTYDIDEINIYDDDDDRVAKTIYETSKDRSDNEKRWTLTVKVKDKGSNKFYVYGYSGNDETHKSFTVKGLEYDEDELGILSISQKSNSVSEGDTVSFTATTTLAAKYIEIEDSDNKIIDSVSSSSKDGDTRIWSFKVPNAREGKNYYMYAYDEDDDDVSKRFTIELDENEDLEILDVDVDETTVDYRDDVRVTVRTTKAAEKVWIEDGDGDKVISKSKHDKVDDDEYIWNLKFEADEKGRVTYTVYAKDDNGETDKETFKIKVED